MSNDKNIYELGNLMAYLHENEQKTLAEYMEIVGSEPNFTKEEFKAFYIMLEKYIYSLKIDNNEYMKLANTDLLMSNLFNLMFRNPRYKIIYGDLTPEYKKALELEKKMFALMSKYLKTIKHDNNNFGISDLFLLATSAAIINAERHNEYVRQVSIYDEMLDQIDIKTHPELLTNMKAKYNFSKTNQEDVIINNINYLEAKIKTK